MKVKARPGGSIETSGIGNPTGASYRSFVVFSEGIRSGYRPIAHRGSLEAEQVRV